MCIRDRYVTVVEYRLIISGVLTVSNVELEVENEITGHVDWTAVGGELLQSRRQFLVLSTAVQAGRLMTTKTRVELANVKGALSSLNIYTRI